MLICGLKLTHDAAVSLLEDNKLIFCVEMEKINNNPRHSHFEDINNLKEILNDFGYKISDVDCFVIDGWKNTYDACDKTGKNFLSIQEQLIEVAPYSRVAIVSNKVHFEYENEPFHSANDVLLDNGESFPYISYSHLYTHLAVAYCTSPFAKRGESCFISVFDGGCKPTLFYFDAQTKKFIFCEEYLNFGGHIYDSTAALFKPYGDGKTIIPGRELIKKDIAGKVMAFIATGHSSEEYKKIFYEIYDKTRNLENNQRNRFAGNAEFCREVLNSFDDACNSADVLSSFHDFLKELIVENLLCATQRSGYKCSNLCLSGGCALNIKWNSAIRNTGVFKEIYIPPFTNDSGSAIGAACAEMMRIQHQYYIDWNVYCGNKIGDESVDDGWESSKCCVDKLARLIFDSQEPVVVLSGRSEGGPRALGCRSILCDARSLKARDDLNGIKRREWYRPVAPICLEEDSTLYFSPGGSDKYMLFEHQATEFAHSNVPAVIHLDGSSRLQTIAKEDNEIVYSILKSYKEISGISVLCNTSANNLGKGFFPDVKSAQLWGRCKYIWSEGILYTKISV